MSNLYVFDGSDNEALTNYIEDCDVAKHRHAHLKRNGGAIHEVRKCFFCGETIARFQAVRAIEGDHGFGKSMLQDFEPHESIYLVLCNACGWFRLQKHLFFTMPIFPIVVASSAVLEKKEISDDEIPLEELRSYLARKWGDRRKISPGQAEQLVASIFKEHLDGEIVYTTNGVYSPDGGIDFVVVQTQSGIEYAFQVKRRLTNKPECVQNVRAFVGAVATSSYTHGYYVTTAPRFTSTTVREMDDLRDNLTTHNLRIELIDGSKLHGLLQKGTCRRPSFAALKCRVGDDRSKWWRVDEDDAKSEEYSSLSELLQIANSA